MLRRRSPENKVAAVDEMTQQQYAPKMIVYIKNNRDNYKGEIFFQYIYIYVYGFEIPY